MTAYSETPAGWPRRRDVLRWSAAERAISDAVQAVERVGADVALTDAVILLGQAQERVADYVDAHPTTAPHPVRLERSEEWWLARADREGDADVSAGALPHSAEKSGSAPAAAREVMPDGARVLRPIPFSEVSSGMLADLCEQEAETVHDLAMRLSVSADANNWIDPESDEARASNVEGLLRFAADRLRAPAPTDAGEVDALGVPAEWHAAYVGGAPPAVLYFAAFAAGERATPAPADAGEVGALLRDCDHAELVGRVTYVGVSDPARVAGVCWPVARLRALAARASEAEGRLEAARLVADAYKAEREHFRAAHARACDQRDAAERRFVAETHTVAAAEREAAELRGRCERLEADRELWQEVRSVAAELVLIDDLRGLAARDRRRSLKARLALVAQIASIRAAKPPEVE